GSRLPVARALDRIAHLAVDQREERVVAADADVRASVELGAALANDDRAGRDDLAAEHLDAEHTEPRVAAVARRAAAFFLCHVKTPGRGPLSGRVDRADADFGEILAMALALLVVLALVHLEDADLRVAAVRNDVRDDAGTGDKGSAEHEVGAA